MNESLPKIQSSGKEFTLILIAAVILSFAFVQWFKSPQNSSAVGGGLEIGKEAPELLADIWVKGERPDQNQLEGDVYVVVAWATWCLPCYEAAPELVETQEKFATEGVRFFGLTAAGPQDEQKIVEWLDDRKITWPNGFGMSAVDTLMAFEGNYLPGLWVIGRDGKVWWNRSMIDDESLEEALSRTLAESKATVSSPADESGA
ncbi:MAG: TlpA disulfide reductase family protein [Planctomycetaceae bacterium]|nr:TlpA disulfide reductase family protein [Planctomycetaceae bacterium]